MITTWTWFRRREHREGLRVVLDRDELRHALAHAGVHSGAKDTLPLVCPATYRGDRRRNDHVERVYMLGLDIDDPQPDPHAAMIRISDALGGVETYAYSTYSSEPGAYRIRAIIPYDAPATGDDHRASWSLVARVLARAGVGIDRACSDPARGYYVWARPPSGVYYHGHVDGDPWPVRYAAEAERARLEREAKERARAAGLPPLASAGNLTARARAYLAKCDPAISGSHGHDQTYLVALRLVRGFGLDVDTAYALMRAEYNPRCRPPWSERDLRRKVEQASRAERVGVGWLAGGGGR